MTDEELENEALDLAGEAWEMVKRGRMLILHPVNKVDSSSIA